MASKYLDRKSRRVTPWDNEDNLTATQAFIKAKANEHYEERHTELKAAGEAEMINSYEPHKCPYCGSEWFHKFGFTSNGIRRFRCGECKRTFLPTTGTIFDERRISIEEWLEYCYNLFRHVSITADSWNNKNAFTTSKYWLQKVFLTLDGCQDSIILKGEVWLDETFYTVRSDKIARYEDGTKLRGISKNQICIGVATDGIHSLFLVEGDGKTSQKKTFETFRPHITRGSTLIHDREGAHTKLVDELGLNSKTYRAENLMGLPDKENPLYPVNHAHAILKRFLRAHSGFDRSEIHGYLNLFAFVSNPPSDQHEKADIFIKTALEHPKSLRY